MAGPPRRRFSLSKLPHSLAIALWVVGSSWAVMIAAYLLDADTGLVVPLVLFGTLTGAAEWMMRGRDK
jgi:hypothetical protein